jgi:hypothetical protein
MGREYIGYCSTDSELGTYEMELAIKYIKRECGRPPRGADVEITWEGYGLVSGEETQYPVISVVWDDGLIDYPNEYIGKRIEAFERFDLPEEIYEQGQKHQAILEGIDDTTQFAVTITAGTGTTAPMRDLRGPYSRAPMDGSRRGESGSSSRAGPRCRLASSNGEIAR